MLPTELANKKVQMLLDYLNTYKNAVIRFYRSDIQLYVYSDAVYLIAPKAKSKKQDRWILLLQPSGLLYNCQTALYFQRMLMALGHPQTNTPVKTDNGTAVQFVKDTIKNKRSKLWDVRYHWLTKRQAKNDFDIYWDKGENNLTEYHTKHHSPTHHKNMRQKYSTKFSSEKI